jgi:hypothetical protein
VCISDINDFIVIKKILFELSSLKKWTCFFQKLNNFQFKQKILDYVRLSYNPYFLVFLVGTIFFSHNKLANSIFSYDFSAKRTGSTFIMAYKCC